ncbi:MAG: hypothetical protein ACXWJX_06580 [Limisphaerales bacterium]
MYKEPIPLKVLPPNHKLPVGNDAKWFRLYQYSCGQSTRIEPSRTMSQTHFGAGCFWAIAARHRAIQQSGCNFGTGAEQSRVPRGNKIVVGSQLNPLEIFELVPEFLMLAVVVVHGGYNTSRSKISPPECQLGDVPMCFFLQIGAFMFGVAIR